MTKRIPTKLVRRTRRPLLVPPSLPTGDEAWLRELFIPPAREFAELPEWARPVVTPPVPPQPVHSHVTRDVKPRGVCPACDLFWSRVDTTKPGLPMA